MGKVSGGYSCVVSDLTDRIRRKMSETGVPSIEQLQHNVIKWIDPVGPKFIQNLFCRARIYEGRPLRVNNSALASIERWYGGPLRTTLVQQEDDTPEVEPAITTPHIEITTTGYGVPNPKTMIHLILSSNHSVMLSEIAGASEYTVEEAKHYANIMAAALKEIKAPIEIENFTPF